MPVALGMEMMDVLVAIDIGVMVVMQRPRKSAVAVCVVHRSRSMLHWRADCSCTPTAIHGGPRRPPIKHRCFALMTANLDAMMFCDHQTSMF